MAVQSVDIYADGHHILATHPDEIVFLSVNVHIDTEPVPTAL